MVSEEKDATENPEPMTGNSGRPARAIGKMFDAVAPRYDFLNRLLSFGRDLFWRRAASEQLTILGYPGRILDMATGSGDQLIAIRKTWPHAKIAGLDISPAMLARAAAKMEKLLPDDDDAETVLGNVHEAPFPDGVFDSVCVSFGLRNLDDRPGFYREVLRLLKPGGRLVVLELFFDYRNPWAPLHRFHLETLIPLVASGFFGRQKKAYRYLGRSVLNFPHPAVIADEMEEAGFKAVNRETMTFRSAMIVRGQKSFEDKTRP
ncbi:MAG: ubiquinone/menaquinone biosynthesis methyltransferase [Deltaproteobacteria bacterium]|jgi:demethylmenaquinone methyltransferase/2-methoxy-6-polyprenyl-1,4-benzoquinol methylase|nr:ubiquinone/menaquinone biosynthesis methyltransferase [Deltaproteobacteria bacterium]